MSITHNKNLNPLVSLLISCIPAKSASQVLPIKGDCTFLLYNFLITGFYNSSANSLLIFSCLISLPDFLLKNYETIEASPCWYPSYSGFLAISNALAHNTLSAAALLFKSLKYP